MHQNEGQTSSRSHKIDILQQVQLKVPQRCEEISSCIIIIIILRRSTSSTSANNSNQPICRKYRSVINILSNWYYSRHRVYLSMTSEWLPRFTYRTCAHPTQYTAQYANYKIDTITCHWNTICTNSSLCPTLGDCNKSIDIFYKTRGCTHKKLSGKFLSGMLRKITDSLNVRPILNINILYDRCSTETQCAKWSSFWFFRHLSL